MNKKILLGIAIVIVLAAAYLYVSQQKNKVSDNSDSTPAVSKIMGSESMRDLMAKGKPLQCEITQDNVKSKFYFADKNIRTNFVTTVDNKDNIGHMILVDNTTYTWMDGETKGFKMTTSPELNNEGQTNAQNNEQVNLDAKVDYVCSSWSKDKSYFELPAGIEFTDLSSFTQPKANASGETETKTPDLKAIQCAACDSVPEASRAQCKTSLACN